MGRNALCAALLSGCVMMSATALATETETYSYDALGRLVKVERDGDVNDGVDEDTTYDDAGNRTNHTVTGAAPSSANIAIANANITEGGVLSFDVTRSGITTSAVTADWTISDVTTTSGDYSGSTSGTVSFAADDTAESVTLQTTDDSTFEGDETLTATLSNPSSGATITTAAATGTINDNDAGISISDESEEEGDPLGFTVSLSIPAPSTITVDYATSDGTASSSSDYTSDSDTLTYTTGQQFKTVNISTTEDSSQESDETLTVTLSSVTGAATITDATGTGTIEDDDAPTGPYFTISDATEDEDGNRIEFTVTLTGTRSGDTYVDYATVDGSATDPSDYEEETDDIRFRDNDDTKTIRIDLEDDSTAELTETFTVVLSNPTNGSWISDDTGVGTIIDDD